MNTRETIQQGIDYIENNLKSEITVNELCTLAGYSRVHYCRLFQLFVGLSVKEYINRRKLLYAVYDMTKGFTKTHIAFAYGFNTYAGFYKAFKREFNCSPCEFIKFHKGTKPYKINILKEEHIMISKNKIHKLLGEWGLQNETISNIYNENTCSQNENSYYIGNDYIIKFTSNLGFIKRNIDIAEALHKSDIPTFEIFKTVNDNNYLKYGELYFIVTKRIKGKQLKCEDIFLNTDLALCIGEKIAELHRVLKTFDESNYTDVNIYNDAVNYALPEVRNMVNLSDGFVKNYIAEFGSLYKEMPRQIIHRDINPSNMIFDNNEFKGFIDFDLTQVNVRIFDICYCATSILSECFSNQNIDKNLWLEILKKLVLGYGKVNPLTDAEMQAMPYTIYTIQIICIVYFSKFEKYRELAKLNTDILKWIINNI